MTTPDQHRTFRLAIVSAGASDPSTTRLLGDRIAHQVTALGHRRGHEVTTSMIDLRHHGHEISTALMSQLTGATLAEAVETLRVADGLVVSTPVYKAGPSGLFTSFFQMLDDDLLIAKPTVLAATAGTARHALVVDEQMRSTFAYLRTMVVPTSLFAAPEDWADHELTQRIERAALELVLLMESGFANAVTEEVWHSYRHQFGSAGGTEVGIDLDTDLMRLATGDSGPRDSGSTPGS